MIASVVLLVVVAAVVGSALAARRHRAVRLPGGGAVSVAGHPGRPDRGRAGSGLEALLGAWRDAGLLEPSQIDPILRFEDARAEPHSRFPLAAEAVGYVGAALIVGAVASLVANRFDDLGTGPRVAVFAAPAVLAAVAGWWVGTKDDPAFGRLGSVLWVVAAGLLAGTLIEVFVDVVHDGDPPEHGGPLFVGAGVLVWGLVAYLLRRRPLQLLVVFAASVATALGLINAFESGDPHARTYALTLWGLGLVWFAVAAARRATPPELAMVLGAATALIGAQILRGETEVLAIWLGLATAAAFVAWGVGRAEVAALLAGAAGLFQWSPQLAIHYLEDTLGTEATLLVVGLVLVGAAAIFTRLYRRVSAGTGDTAADAL